MPAVPAPRTRQVSHSVHVKQSSNPALKKTKKRIRKRSDKHERSFVQRSRGEAEVAESLTTFSCGKLERVDRISSANRNSDVETTDGSNEANKLNAKIAKVFNYWFKNSMLIPNTFRITCYLEDDERNVMEYQDLSKKEVLAQYNSKQSGSFESEELEGGSGRGGPKPREGTAGRKTKAGARAPFK